MNETVANIRAKFIQKELDQGTSRQEAEYRWLSYASGVGWTYLQRVAKES